MKYVIPAIRLTGTELLSQQKMTLIVKVEKDRNGSVIVSFRRRPWDSHGKLGQISSAVRVLFPPDRITIEPASALMSIDKNTKRNYRLTEVACMALSSVSTAKFPGNDFELDIWKYPGEYYVSIMPFPARPGSHCTVIIKDVGGKLSESKVVPGI